MLTCESAIFRDSRCTKRTRHPAERHCSELPEGSAQLSPPTQRSDLRIANPRCASGLRKDRDAETGLDYFGGQDFSAPRGGLRVRASGDRAPTVHHHVYIRCVGRSSRRQPERQSRTFAYDGAKRDLRPESGKQRAIGFCATLPLPANAWIATPYTPMAT